jgi:hypothetical protein
MAAILTTTFTAGAALAQQAEPARDPAQAESAEAARPEPLHKIRVLDNPYDIASYYRSRQGSGFFTGSSERYPIASFYRSRQSSPYGQFWAVGYGVRDRRGLSLFRRSIGENGDRWSSARSVRSAARS